MLDELRRHGTLDPSDESALIRHYDDVLREVNEQKARLEPEYARRRRETVEAADHWLADAAAALGRRHSEAMRQVLERIPALANDAS